MARSPNGRPPLDHRWRLAHRQLNGLKAPRPVHMAEYAARVLPGSSCPSARLVEVAREAILLYGSEDPQPRDNVEAWLLCELSPADVAARTGVEEPVVTAYRDLFFDVGPYMADDWAREDLAWLLLGHKLHEGIEENDLTAWKRYAALTNGPIGLERYLDYLRALPLILPSDVSGLSDPDLRRLRDLLVMRVWVLSNVPLKTAAQRLRLEFVCAVKETQRVWPPEWR